MNGLMDLWDCTWNFDWNIYPRCFNKVANTFGAVAAFIASSAVMVYIKYFVPADKVTIWSYSIISIVVSLVIGIPASIIWRKVKGDKSVPAPNTTIFKN